MERGQDPPRFNLYINSVPHGHVNTMSRATSAKHFNQQNGTFNTAPAKSAPGAGGITSYSNSGLDYSPAQYTHNGTEPFPEFVDIDPKTMEYQAKLGSSSHNTGIRRSVEALQAASQTLEEKIDGNERYVVATPSVQHQVQNQAMPATTQYKPATTMHQQLRYQFHAPAPLKNGFIAPRHVNMVNAESNPTTSSAGLPGLNHNFVQQLQSPDFSQYHTTDIGEQQATTYPQMVPVFPAGLPAPQTAGFPASATQSSYAPLQYPYFDQAVGSSMYTPAYQPPFLANGMGPPMVSGSQFTTTGIPDAAAILQNSYLMAEAAFHSLSHRERLIDQYLAMNREKLDYDTKDALVRQRYGIHEERAKAKESMNTIQKALDNMSSASSRLTIPRGENTASSSNGTGECRNGLGQGLNVRAPSWTPAGQSNLAKGTSPTENSAVNVSKPTTDNVGAPAVDSLHSGKALSLPRMKLKIDTAITSVNNNSQHLADPFTTITTGVHNAEKVTLDEWGARVGSPPAELARQQRQLAETLGANCLFSGSSSETVHNKAGQGVEQEAKERPNAKVPGTVIHSRESTGAGNGMWEFDKRGRAPSAVERDYELYLDALRKSAGIVTSITLGNGRKQEVVGVGLKQPPLEHLNDFEKEYWGKKPDRVLSPTSNDKKHATCEDADESPEKQKAAQTEEWVNGVGSQAIPGLNPWSPPETTNSFCHKSRSSISLQSINAVSNIPAGTDGAAELLERRLRRNAGRL
jgi:hypothetical protein